MQNLGRKILDALITSIPLFIMAMLSIVTWWLVVITPDVPNIIKQKSLEGMADLVVNDFIAERFDSSGALRSNLKGKTAERYPASDEIVVYGVDLMTTESSDNSKGVQPILGTPGVDFFKVTAISDKGIIHNQTSIIELLNNAYVTRQPLDATGTTGKAEFRGDELIVLVSENKMISNQPVDITQDGNRAISQSMVYNHATNIVDMRGKVRVLLVDANP